MRTLNVLCALLSLTVSSAFAQASASKGVVWQVDPVAQRDRDEARKTILEDELAAEAWQFTEAYAELRAARTRHAPAERLEDVTGRVNRHRRNIAELALEIARGEGDIRGKGNRSPKAAADDWLIPVQPANSGHPEWLAPADRKHQ